ncbi:MAG: protein kinase [Deltaproteobacteria bacterium]|nr:protein kinase [Deltaproteobacteria bacterium]
MLDFGVAKLGGAEQGVTLTRTGATMGTPFYMAPEQARGEKQLDERADVYALGVILYEALSGQVPHPGESYNAVIYHILTKQPQPLAELRPGLPPELLEVIARALAHEPQERFGNAAELGEALASFARAPAPPEARQRDRAGSATTVAEQLTGEQPADGGGTDGDGAARRPSETDIALVAAGLRRSGRVSAGRRRLFGGAAALVLALVALVVWQAREPPQDAVGQPSGLASAGEPPATATQAPAVATGVPPPTALPADPAGAPEAPSAGRPDARPDVHSDTTGKPRRGDAPPRATTQPAATAAPAATPEGASRGPTGFDRDNPY